MGEHEQGSKWTLACIFFSFFFCFFIFSLNFNFSRWEFSGFYVVGFIVVIVVKNRLWYLNCRIEQKIFCRWGRRGNNKMSLIWFGWYHIYILHIKYRNQHILCRWTLNDIFRHVYHFNGTSEKEKNKKMKWNKTNKQNNVFHEDHTCNCQQRWINILNENKNTIFIVSIWNATTTKKRTYKYTYTLKW